MLLLLLLSVFLFAAGEEAPLSIHALCDQSVRNYRLLTPPEAEANVDNGSQRNCACQMVHQAPWGAAKVHIDCSALDLQTELVQATHMPFGSQLLDLSWNKLTRLPRFSLNVDQLEVYRLHNNHIEKLTRGDLTGLTALRELDLSNNALASLDFDTFKDLGALETLKMGYNVLQELPESLFRPMKQLRHLTLSGNNLNELLREKNLIYDLQVSESLEVLELEYCQLTWLSVESAGALQELRLRGNGFFRQLPLLPPSVELLDMSANPVRRLDMFYDGQLGHLQVLLLEDMPNLYLLDFSSLTTHPSLRKISLQNSRNFTYLSEGSGVDHPLQQLRELKLTGTKVRKISKGLKEYMPSVKVIALDGCPMVCDCDLKWLMGGRLGIVTNGVCDKPLSIRDQNIDGLVPESIKNCSELSRVMFRVINGVLVLFLLVLCAVAMYFLVMGCRPSKKFFVRQRMGVQSPYSRITVEPIGETYRPTTISQG